MSNPLGFKQYLLSLLILGSITLLQAMSGTRFVYSACYKLMEQHYGISRVQLNNLIVASEIGRLFGYFPIVAAEYLPEWMILIIGLIFGSVGYGMQYLSINVHPFLSYWQILLFSVLAGNSICWISTYCDLVAIRNFKNSHETVSELTSSYCGLTGKIYTSFAEGIRGRNVVSQDSSLYLLLSCLAPTVVGLAMAFLNCLVQVVEYEETKLFPSVFMIVIATGVYAGVESIAQPFTQMSPQLRVVILLLFVMLPLLVALLMAAKQLALAKWDSQEVPAEVTDTVVSESKPKRPATNEGLNITIEDQKREGLQKAEQTADEKVTDRQAAGNDNENGLKELLTNEDFWLFYCMNMCGATLGMVYLNNLEIISKSHGYHKASLLLATSSTFNFFGRTFSVIFTWYTRETSTISKPALIMLLMIPMPLAFFLLISSNKIFLYISTCIIGTGSGAINAIIATSTSEFFGSANSLVKQTIIVPTNVPLGTLLFGYLAASNYDSEGSEDRNICMGLKCHHLAFTIWGSFSSIGTLLSFSLYLRKRKGHL